MELGWKIMKKARKISILRASRLVLALDHCRLGRTIFESFCSRFVAIGEFIDLNIRLLRGKSAITFYFPKA
jgi:hypothetical protein